MSTVFVLYTSRPYDGHMVFYRGSDIIVPWAGCGCEFDMSDSDDPLIFTRKSSSGKKKKSAHAVLCFMATER